jgi:hypothetical protein
MNQVEEIRSRKRVMCASSIAAVLRVPIFLPPRPLQLLIFFESRDPVNKDKNEKQFLLSVVLNNRHQEYLFLCRLLKMTDKKNTIFDNGQNY